MLRAPGGASKRTFKYMKNIKFLSLLVTFGLWSAGALALDSPAPAPGHSTSVPLAPDAPSVYTVKRGDTLWAIAGKFLTKPWYWPEIWYLNTDIKNPHLIYPGDTLRLVYDANGKPHLVLERGDVVHLSPQVRTKSLGDAIPAIPYEIVAAFMAKPSVITKEDAERLPYVVGLGEGHVTGGTTDKLYVRNVSDPAGTRFNIVRMGEALKDPDTGEFLGYEGIYTGTAVVERPSAGSDDKNDFARLTITEAGRETMPGERLMAPPPEVEMDFVPHAPDRPVNGKIVSVMNGVNVVGRWEVVTINQGKLAGLEPGHVLEIYATGERIKDRGTGGLTGSMEFNALTRSTVKLPDEPVGTFMVFRAYDHMSFGLVLSLDRPAPAHVGDAVKNP